MRIIALGNPGKEYQYTRHNAGQIVADLLLEDREFLSEHRIMIEKTKCFMNVSGDYLKRVLKLTKQSLKNTIIAHDDSDLELGTFKLQYDRGAAGHNGIQSIIDVYDTHEFLRLRVGIRTEFDEGNKAQEFVLKNFSKKELQILEKIMPKIKEAIRKQFS